jgi:nucleotide sugar dehydrogenase
MRVAVIGTGFIGKAQIRMLAQHDADIVTYDTSDDKPYPRVSIALCDFAIVCVGTPEAEDGSADLRYVFAAVRELPSDLPVVIRSTIPPGTTARLQATRPGWVCHVPEFMHEREGGAWSETTDVPFLVIGCMDRGEQAMFFADMLTRLFPGKIFVTSAAVSEMVKYVVNLHLATRITFINEMAAVCKAHGVDWELVRDAWLMDPRITPEYTGMKGFEPGFGGRCWPKDLAAIIYAAETAGYEPEFLHAIQDANARFRSA